MACRTAFAPARNASVCRQDCAHAAGGTHFRCSDPATDERNVARIYCPNGYTINPSRSQRTASSDQSVRACRSAFARPLRTCLHSQRSMMPAIMLSRPASSFGEAWGCMVGSVRKGKGGWRDKSTAVGRGAGGWFYWLTCAVLANALPSLLANFPAISTAHAPTPRFIAHG